MWEMLKCCGELETIVLGFISGDTVFRWVELTLGL